MWPINGLTCYLNLRKSRTGCEILSAIYPQGLHYSAYMESATSFFPTASYSLIILASTARAPPSPEPLKAIRLVRYMDLNTLVVEGDDDDDSKATDARTSACSTLGRSSMTDLSSRVNLCSGCPATAAAVAVKSMSASENTD